MRQIVLDTETTGLEAEQGHRVIEIGAVELVNRRLSGRHFHKYLNPERAIDEGAQEVHGLSSEFLADKPHFADIAGEFVDFVNGAELVIHNAAFDLAFLNSELSLLDQETHGSVCKLFGNRRQRRLQTLCEVTDSLALARNRHPGQRNNLDALCRRYAVDNSARTLHGALLDAEILADVYLLMTGGQTMLFASGAGEQGQSEGEADWQPPAGLQVLAASADELTEHEAYLALLDEQAGAAIWRRHQL